MKSFAESVTKVSEISFECVGEGIALSLKDKSFFVILLEKLVNSRGAGVGRDDEH